MSKMNALNRLIQFGILLSILILAGCTPKQEPNFDPWQDSASDETVIADSDTLTYNFLEEAEAEVSPPADEVADLPVIADSGVVETVEAEVEAIPVAPVEVEVPRVPDVEEGPLFWVQLFASGSRKSAEEIALQADAKIEDRVRILFLDPYYKVLAGGFSNREEAVELRREMTEMGYKDAWIFEK